MKKLQVINFESHKDTTVVFSLGVNIITGATDVGKSSLRRACEWVICNRPLGTEFINWDSKATTVILDGVEKYRSQGGKHFYKCSGKVYKAFGHGVPGAVTRELRLTQENIQEQHDPYFLINDSPGQVARILNSVTDLSLIDRCLKEGKKRIRKTITRLEIIDEQAQERETKRESLLWAEEAIKEVDHYEQFVRTEKTLDGQTAVLKKLITKAQNPELEILNLVTEDLEQVKTYRLKAEDREARIKLLGSLISQAEAPVQPPVIEDLEQVQKAKEILKDSRIKNLKSLLQRASPVAFPLATVDIQILQNQRVKIKSIKTRITVLETKIKDYETGSKNLQALSNDYNQQKKAFDMELKSLGICPLCGGNL